MEKFILFLCVFFWLSVSHAEEHEYYPQSALAKANNGIFNIISAPLEIPKSIINTTNDNNIFYGIVGGAVKGIVNTGGRIAVGSVDLITAPFPTKPIVYPEYVWDDFNVDTRYGDVFSSPE